MATLSELFGDFTDPPEAYTVHIHVLSDDRLGSRGHEIEDVAVLAALEREENKRLKHPKGREDYINFVNLVATCFGTFENACVLNRAMEDIRANYNSEETTDEAWADFKRLIDTCLAERKFRMIRCLREFMLEQ